MTRRKVSTGKGLSAGPMSLAQLKRHVDAAYLYWGGKVDCGVILSGNNIPMPLHDVKWDESSRRFTIIANFTEAGQKYKRRLM